MSNFDSLHKTPIAASAHPALKAHMRLICADDMPAMLNLWVESWKATFPDIDFDARREWFTGHMHTQTAQGAKTICIFDTDGMLGFVTINSVRQWLDQLCLHPRAYGSGIAQHLLQAARCISPQHIKLDVNADNTKALRFYLREGFIVTGHGVNARSQKNTVLLSWHSQQRSLSADSEENTH